jgi:DNA-binding MarR family transcriptional regulator
MSITKDIILALKKVQENTEISISNNDGALSFSQIHCIAVIGDIKGANVTKISKELVMTTGAITKMCKKLFNKGFVDRYQNTENNKEIYYMLTDTGQYVYKIHKKIHDKTNADKESIITQYNDDEKSIILRFLNDINSMTNNTFIEVTKDDE